MYDVKRCRNRTRLGNVSLLHCHDLRPTADTDATAPLTDYRLLTVNQLLTSTKAAQFSRSSRFNSWRLYFSPSDTKSEISST